MISTSITITIVVLIVSKLIIIRIELLISKEGRFVINLLLLLLIYSRLVSEEASPKVNETR
jgi:hypothetical protein